MSYSVWSVDGYGICVDKIHTTEEKIKELVEFASKTKKHFEESFGNSFSLSEVNEYEGRESSEYGFAALLADVMTECEDIFFTACCNFDNNGYVLFEPRYPWAMGEKENTLTSEKLDKIFKKYIAVLTDEDIIINFYSVENGG